MAPIVVLNLLLGWTVIGWVGALVWALVSGEEAASGATAGASALRACPHCAEQIQRPASVCRFCGRDVEPLPALRPYTGVASYYDPKVRKNP